MRQAFNEKKTLFCKIYTEHDYIYYVKQANAGLHTRKT